MNARSAHFRVGAGPLSSFRWFNERRYRDLRKLTAIGWHEQLARRVGIAQALAPELVGREYCDLSIKHSAEAEWEAIKQDPLGVCGKFLNSLGWNLRSLSPGMLRSMTGVHAMNFTDVGILLWSLRLTLSRQQVRELYRYARRTDGESFRSWMNNPTHTGQIAGPAFGYVCVDLELPDSKLETRFREWLQEARSVWRTERTAVAPEGGNFNWLDKLPALRRHSVQWRSWADMRLLQCADLLISAAINNLELSNVQLSMHLYGERRHADSLRLGARPLLFSLMETFGGLDGRFYKELRSEAVLELLQEARKNEAKKNI